MNEKCYQSIEISPKKYCIMCIDLQLRNIQGLPQYFLQWNLTNTGLGKSDLNEEVTVLQGTKLPCGIQVTLMVRWPY